MIMLLFLILQQQKSHKISQGRRDGRGDGHGDRRRAQIAQAPPPVYRSTNEFE